MDPETTFDEFALARSEGRIADAGTHARTLAEWLRDGGAIPAAMAQWNPGRTAADLRDWMGGYARTALGRSV